MQLDEDGNFIDMYDIGEKIKVKKRYTAQNTRYH